MSELAAPLAPGTLLGDRFEIGDAIGSGGMGAVFRAHDRSADAPAAVKILHPRLVTSRDYVSRFKREALAASRFRHESAVKVLASGETDGGLPFIAMELVDGRSLKEILATDGPLPVGRACNVAHQLLRALGAAHHRGIVHRDMKPDNVRVVVDEDGIERPKILDFGIVKFIGGDPGEFEGAVKTKTGIVLGTPKYMAPEQIRGEVVDGRADVYAVGAMLYEMLAGEPPFVADDVFGFVAMHLKQDVTPLARRAPERDVPAGLDEVVLHMLEKSPADRPADATVLADRIERWAVEDPNAAEKGRALRTGMSATVVAGALTAVLAFVVAPSVAPAVAAAGLGLGLGAALAARLLPRPSVFGYAKRLLLVTGCVGALAAAALLPAASPGLYVAFAFGLAAVLTYVAYLTVWSLRSRWPRFVAGGVAAPLAIAALLPVRVLPASGKPYFVAILAGTSDDLAALETAARMEALAGVALLCVLFALASLALPKPAAARI